MATTSVKERLKRVQRFLGVDDDGIFGVGTLSALERHLFPSTGIPDDCSLRISRSALDKLVNHEIGSPAYYRKRLQKPTWPGGASGVTIGIGYDLGYNKASQIRKDWQAYCSSEELALLCSVAGLKGEEAKSALVSVSEVKISLDEAVAVFFATVLPRYGKLTLKAYPGVDQLEPDAQGALLSLVYNRGTKMSGSSRREMKALQPLVTVKNYPEMAKQVRLMKRLWEGKGLDGLLKRRDDEAHLLEGAERVYQPDELVMV